eukprot:63290-Pleurochrysis_carterae.AAC.1
MSDAAGGFERLPACAALTAGCAGGGTLSASSRRGEGVDEKKGSETRSAGIVPWSASRTSMSCRNPAAICRCRSDIVCRGADAAARS